MYGGGTQVLVAQLIGSLIVTSSTFAVAYVVMFAVNAMGYLRVEREGEVMGLDLYEHGISAYPEYVITATPRPAAMVTAVPLGSPQPSALSPQPSARVATEPSH